MPPVTPHTQAFLNHLGRETEALRTSGLYKDERVITSPQDAVIRVAGGREVINFCANNYLGLANHPAADPRGAGRPRPIRLRHGLGALHLRHAERCTRQLEQRLSAFLGTEDTILYCSCFDANGGLFETLLGEEDAVISDALNHASIIDGVRLCKAQRFRYANNDMADLEAQLKAAARRALQAHRHRRRVFDGRHHRQPEGDLRSGATSTARW